jgi:hypothetical protein
MYFMSEIERVQQEKGVSKTTKTKKLVYFV